MANVNGPANRDWIHVGGDGDTMRGGGGNNVITGNTGNNALSGLDGNDTLGGGDGNDSLWGGTGKDILIGGAGTDTMNGGGQADAFRFAVANTGLDRIDGFETALDRFDLVGGSFSVAAVSGGNTTLTHAGGKIIVTGVTALDLDGWNALVLPAGGSAAAEDPVVHRAGGFDLPGTEFHHPADDILA